jgi:nitrate reductase gamma subunit
MAETMIFTTLLTWIWLALAVFVVCCGWRIVKYARAPEHLRWDLYPVAHEPGRDHGGSHLEQKDWWTRPRRKSHWGEISFMMLEILLLKGVWENNRKVWWGSFPFHWGLYILVLTTAGLLAAAVGIAAGPWPTLLASTGVLGGGLTAIGALILLVLRSTDPRLRPCTSPLDRLNLALLVLLGTLSAAVAAMPAGMETVATAVGRIARLRSPEVSFLVGLQMTVAALFLFYFPFTRMIHLFAKYFTYHAVRWDDRQVKPGSRLEKRLRAALDFGVTWSADHLQTGKTWLEIATRIPEPPKKDGG